MVGAACGNAWELANEMNIRSRGSVFKGALDVKKLSIRFRPYRKQKQAGAKTSLMRQEEWQ